MESCLIQIEKLKPVLETANHTDVKVIDGHCGLQEFIASMFSYNPWWIVFLFRVRKILVRIFGLETQPKPEQFTTIGPENVSFTPGDTMSFFTVRYSKKDAYWVGETPPDKHLIAYIAVVMEPQDKEINRFHVATIVQYKHWTGPVYFNLIRPFHHLVVRRMMSFSIKGK